MVSLFQCAVPLWRVLMMQSAVSTVTGARKQQDHLAGGASKEQLGTCRYTTECVCVCVCKPLLEFTQEEERRLAKNCRLNKVMPLISWCIDDNQWEFTNYVIKAL